MAGCQSIDIGTASAQCQGSLCFLAPEAKARVRRVETACLRPARAMRTTRRPVRARARLHAMHCGRIRLVSSASLPDRPILAGQPAAEKKGCVQLQVQVQSGRDASTMKKFRVRRYTVQASLCCTF